MAVIDQAAVSVRSIVPLESIDHRSQNATPTIAILAFIGAFAIAKLLAARASGFTGDEAYTIVISRSFQLSYFDHPPLHQWIV
ncbi:MAG: hypothetical protein WA579_17755, partial [Rhodomicrobium sp.]